MKDPNCQLCNTCDEWQKAKIADLHQQLADSSALNLKLQEALRATQDDNGVLTLGLRAITNTCENCVTGGDLREIARRTLEGVDFSKAKPCDSCAFEVMQSQLTTKISEREQEIAALKYNDIGRMEVLKGYEKDIANQVEVIQSLKDKNSELRSALRNIYDTASIQSSDVCLEISKIAEEAIKGE
jgi:DNA-binding ferritin-like protein